MNNSNYGDNRGFYNNDNWKEVSQPVMVCGLIECCRNRGGQCLIAGQIVLNESGQCRYAVTKEWEE